MNKTWKRIIWWCEFLIPIAVALPFLFNAVVLVKGKPASQALGVVLLTALFWIFEPIPIVVTSFFPIILMPLFGVSSAKAIAASMFTDTSLIFLGGFIFSIAMVRWNLHSRIALKTVIIFGLKPKILLLGIIIVTAFLSMWISNTATALTMVPNAIAIITKIEEMTGDVNSVAPFAKSLFLGIAYSASIGGMATLIGTPPNLIFAQVSADTFKDAPPIGFAQFLFVALPVSIVIIVVMYLFFVIFYMRKIKLPANMDETQFKESYERLGKWSPAEIIIGIMFILLALLWFFRQNLEFGPNAKLIGWTNRLFAKGSTYIQDGTVALIMAILLFIIRVPAPSAKFEKKLEAAEVDLELRKRNFHNAPKFHTPLEMSSDDEEEEIATLDQEIPSDEEDPDKMWVPLVDWEYVQSKIPWTILFLFSGGFALNQGFKDSTLDAWIGSNLSGLTNLPLFVLLLCITFLTTALSNIASNTACANILLPIVAALAKNSKKYHPWVLMIPTAFATSCCFIMPVATPPNLICFGSGRLTTKDFVTAGTAINILSLLIVIGMCMVLIPPVFNAKGFPDWALDTPTNSTASA